MQKLARKLRKSVKDVYSGDDDDDYSLPTSDDSRPIDIQGIFQFATFFFSYIRLLLYFRFGFEFIVEQKQLFQSLGDWWCIVLVCRARGIGPVPRDDSRATVSSMEGLCLQSQAFHRFKNTISKKIKCNNLQHISYFYPVVIFAISFLRWGWIMFCFPPFDFYVECIHWTGVVLHDFPGLFNDSTGLFSLGFGISPFLYYSLFIFHSYAVCKN